MSQRNRVQPSKLWASPGFHWLTPSCVPALVLPWQWVAQQVAYEAARRAVAAAESGMKRSLPTAAATAAGMTPSTWN